LLQRADTTLLIRAKKMIFAAGKGNADLLEKLGLTHPETQLRPLHQVLIKHNLGHRFYGHCLGVESTPRLTISSHPTADGKLVWYMGGSLAENGAQQTPADVIASAQQELATLMPWLDFSASEWATLPVVRAEQRQKQFARPDDAFVGPATGTSNLLVAWPTKLTLTPNLAGQVLAILSADGVKPGPTPANLELLRQYFPHPPIAPTPWELAFPVTHEVSDEE
jgi:glycerol-3-phosphate dehydrogenase